MAAVARITKDPPKKLTVVPKPPSPYADPDDVAEFAEGLPERFLYCREMGHNWRPLSAGRFKDGGYERILRCARCRTERHQELTAWGIVMKSKYIFPDGYISKGLGRIVGDGRGILRLESIKRITAKTKEA